MTQIDTLRSLDNKFAQSLVKQYDERGSLSDKQWWWVSKLAVEASMVAPTTGVDLSKIVELMEHAKQHLKFPKFGLEAPSGQRIVLNLAGNRSKYPGTVAVTDGGPYGDNKYFGRIMQDGSWQGHRTCPQEVVDVLESMAHNPASVAAQHGHRTGNCCFCNHKLTSYRSTSVGYGPDCAKRWGLEWGAVADTI